MLIEKLPNIVEHYEFINDNFHYLVAVEHEGDRIINAITVKDVGNYSNPVNIYGVALSIILDVVDKYDFYLPELTEPNNTPTT